MTFVKYVTDPLYLRLAGRRWFPTHALLETTGRRSGQPRVVAVGNGLVGSTFWIVTEHGYRSHYVRNIQADPAVRVKVGGRWREGRAILLPDDDARARQRTLGKPVVASVVRALGTELLTVRIDLDPDDRAN